ncbi:flagellar hook-length control protein FliK [Azospirillum thermophilum]|uniref:Flagellar hook-length control protein-like C-terminal domain-containing protein n=1 Tax=Azospirillum thermophilum TaxID=2202148 RepID=A0A2S2CUW2_9PROT|nr:flagellar hook-length control protein FliK [Azospirillum thermophilum]AWK88259.1 hypothetical protein DEW08_19365 [Azospirillum thermophilum]
MPSAIDLAAPRTAAPSPAPAAPAGRDDRDDPSGSPFAELVDAAGKDELPEEDDSKPRKSRAPANAESALAAVIPWLTGPQADTSPVQPGLAAANAQAAPQAGIQPTAAATAPTTAAATATAEALAAAQAAAAREAGQPELQPPANAAQTAADLARTAADAAKGAAAQLQTAQAAQAKAPQAAGQPAAQAADAAPQTTAQAAAQAAQAAQAADAANQAAQVQTEALAAALRKSAGASEGEARQTARSEARSADKAAGDGIADARSAADRPQQRLAADSAAGQQAGTGNGQGGQPGQPAPAREAMAAAQPFQPVATAVDGFPALSAHAASHYSATVAEHAAAARPPASQIASPLLRVVETGGGEFRIELTPPDLGHVRVVAEVTDGRVSLNVQAENADTLNLLRRDLHHLERALSGAGFELDGGTLQFSLRGDDQSRGFAGLGQGQGQGAGQGSGQDAGGRPFIPREDPVQAAAAERATILIDGLVDVTV